MDNTRTRLGFSIKNITSIQMDHNSTCNLKCPQCARVEKGEVNPFLPLKELSLDFYKKIFTPELCQQLDSVLFCGNYGDAIASSNILEVCQYLKSNDLKSITIFTNGSLRPPSWWKQLASILSGKNDKVCFSIDGLEDTNPLYRIGSHFNKIIENAQAFIGSGGRARWDYLVFEHNEYQVEQALELARTLGFLSFKIKKTSRFIKDPQYKDGTINSSDIAQKKIGSQIFNSYSISNPQQPQYRSSASSDFKKIVKKYNSWKNYVDKTPIRCKALMGKSLFIDFDGRLWPCTWVGAPVYFYNDDNTQRVQISLLEKRYGRNFNNLHDQSLPEALDHIWFKNDLPDSWSQSTESNNFKLMTCGRTCGNEYQFSSNDKSNQIEQDLRV